jgi:hypothetical protein
MLAVVLLPLSYFILRLPCKAINKNDSIFYPGTKIEEKPEVNKFKKVEHKKPVHAPDVPHLNYKRQISQK